MLWNGGQRRRLVVLDEAKLSYFPVFVGFFIDGKTKFAFSGDVDELPGSSGLLQVGLHVSVVAGVEFSSRGFFTRG